MTRQMFPPKMTAQQILQLLREKHLKDVFVPECKVGPTLSGVNGSIRLDAWAMRNSWAQPTTWGYEIKVSRADFLGDTKWRSYLPYCSDFYFVCPAELIQPAELPSDVGLLWVSMNRTRLYAKRKAPSREVQIPESIWRYVLMWRTGAEVGRENRMAAWEHWLAQRKERRDLGLMVRGAIAEKFREQELRQNVLERRLGDLESIRQRLRELGFDPSQPISVWQVDRKAQELLGRDAKWAREKVQGLQRRLGQLESDLAELERAEGSA